MNEQLHPLPLSEMLDRTDQPYRSRFPVHFGIRVIPAETVLDCVSAIFVFFGGPSSDIGGIAANSLQTYAVACTRFRRTTGGALLCGSRRLRGTGYGFPCMHLQSRSTAMRPLCFTMTREFE
jgi:hypothetical protein